MRWKAREHCGVDEGDESVIYNGMASSSDRQWDVSVESFVTVSFESIGLELVNDRAHHVGLERCLTVMALVRPSALVVL